MLRRRQRPNAPWSGRSHLVGPLTRPMFGVVLSAVFYRHIFPLSRRAGRLASRGCLVLLFAVMTGLGVVPPAWSQKVPVVEEMLPNGMRLLMVERHDDPTIAGGWVAHVGSANERPGITGIAHLFEHMMF